MLMIKRAIKKGEEGNVFIQFDMTSANRMTRIHAPFVSEGEIEKINSFFI